MRYPTTIKGCIVNDKTLHYNIYSSREGIRETSMTRRADGCR